MAYFRESQFACNDTAKTMPTGEALTNARLHMKMLEEFHNWYNREMRINSWYRTPEYNQKIGGEVNSQHTLARVRR